MSAMKVEHMLRILPVFGSALVARSTISLEKSSNSSVEAWRQRKFLSSRKGELIHWHL
jgi:hypothetical protein